MLSESLCHTSHCSSKKGKPGATQAETKWLVIDYRELDKQIPKVQMTQAKATGGLALIESTKIDHIWSKLRETKYLTILDIRSGYHYISIHQIQDQRLHLFVYMWNAYGG